MFSTRIRIIVCLLVCAAGALAFQDGDRGSNCTADPDCTTWSDIYDLTRVPYKVETCCSTLKLQSDGGCPLGDTSYDANIGKCASFCPMSVNYEWGPEVFYLNRRTCGDEENFCTLPGDSRTIFRNFLLPAAIGSLKAIRESFFGGFNNRGVIGYSGNDPLCDAVVDNGGYWTFTPLYKVTCGTYSESLNRVSPDDTCASSARRDLSNVCIREPATNPLSSHSAIGISQLIPVSRRKNNWQQQADTKYWSDEYRQKNVALSYEDDSVRWGFGEFQERDEHVTQTGPSEKPAIAYRTDKHSPLTLDCIDAASEFYMPLWNNQASPNTSTWTANCGRQVGPGILQNGTEVTRPCAVIGSYGTCEIQLIFNVIGYIDEENCDVVCYYNRGCAHRDGGGVWTLLSAFQKILDEATEGGRTAGSMELYGDRDYSSFVAFVPSDGTKVTPKS